MREAMELKVLNTGGTETGEVVTLRDDISCRICGIWLGGGEGANVIISNC